MSVHKEVKRVTTHVLSEMKLKGEKISMLTSYDYSMAKLVDEAGTDVILVGDSASNVMMGNETTLPITLDQMIFMGTSVVKATNRALVVIDLPFGTYQGNSKKALSSAIRIMKETAADAVKLEGGNRITSYNVCYTKLLRLIEASEEVRDALNAGRALVALESTIVTHGMPYPQNVETALKVEIV